MDDWRDEAATASGPEVIEENLSGWYWHRDLRSATRIEGAWRLESGHLEFQDRSDFCRERRNGYIVTLPLHRSKLFTSESAALYALGDHLQRRADRLRLSAGGLERKAFRAKMAEEGGADGRNDARG